MAAPFKAAEQGGAWRAETPPQQVYGRPRQVAEGSRDLGGEARERYYYGRAGSSSQLLPGGPPGRSPKRRS